jgi:hypothetical protein
MEESLLIRRRKPCEEVLAGRRDSLAQAIFHVKEVLLIIGEPVPCMNPLLMIWP